MQPDRVFVVLSESFPMRLIDERPHCSDMASCALVFEMGSAQIFAH